MKPITLLAITEHFYDVFPSANYEQERRDRIRAETKRAAEACDCWKVAGPLCAKCKLAQVKLTHARNGVT